MTGIKFLLIDCKKKEHKNLSTSTQDDNLSFSFCISKGLALIKVLL